MSIIFCQHVLQPGFGEILTVFAVGSTRARTVPVMVNTASKRGRAGKPQSRDVVKHCYFIAVMCPVFRKILDARGWLMSIDVHRSKLKPCCLIKSRTSRSVPLHEIFAGKRQACDRGSE